MSCPLCGPGPTRPVIQTRDFRFGDSVDYAFVACARCGLVYLNPRPDGATIGALYERHYTPDVPSATSFRVGRDGTMARAWRRFTGSPLAHATSRARGRVLDVGCGPGELLVQLAAAGHAVRGVESNSRYGALHGELGIDVFPGMLEDAGFADASFDTVILSQVIEHVPDPVATLREVRRLLAPGGAVFVYCPNAAGYLRRWFARYWHGWHVPFHFWVFDHHTLPILAERAGLQVRRLKAVTPNDFFVTSAKSYLYRRDPRGRAVERGGWLDHRVARLAMAPLFRTLDALMPSRADCLIAELEYRV